jgi:hypothetical protein
VQQLLAGTYFLYSTCSLTNFAHGRNLSRNNLGKLKVGSFNGLTGLLEL